MAAAPADNADPTARGLSSATAAKRLRGERPPRRHLVALGIEHRRRQRLHPLVDAIIGVFFVLILSLGLLADTPPSA